SGAPSAWLSVIASRDFGRFNLTLNVGGLLQFPKDGVEGYLLTALGASYDFFRGLRFGLDGFANIDFDEKGPVTDCYLGPALAWGYGRFWLSFTFGFGVFEQRGHQRGRLVAGVSL